MLSVRSCVGDLSCGPDTVDLVSYSLQSVFGVHVPVAGVLDWYVHVKASVEAEV